MPFGMKNTGATYQRLINKIFIEQIGRTVEVYIDDMLAFAVLQAQNMMFTVGVRAEKFLGFMVSERGIEVNPEKI
ncbi:protein SRG1 [Gossypium australe]|uniref:Protein SRG1 n=1 Tax=Gossypium australe TaxID=47621 RepID=A0A5B6WQ78_9ROSI|nr:protein SRG1 [Gossypium australe]